MHSFDSLARALAHPTRPAGRPRPASRTVPILSHLIAIGCALAPLAVVSHAYLLTA